MDAERRHLKEQRGKQRQFVAEAAQDGGGGGGGRTGGRRTTSTCRPTRRKARQSRSAGEVRRGANGKTGVSTSGGMRAASAAAVDSTGSAKVSGAVFAEEVSEARRSVSAGAVGGVSGRGGGAVDAVMAETWGSPGTWHPECAAMGGAGAGVAPRLPVPPMQSVQLSMRSSSDRPPRRTGIRRTGVRRGLPILRLQSPS